MELYIVSTRDTRTDRIRRSIWRETSTCKLDVWNFKPLKRLDNSFPEFLDECLVDNASMKYRENCQTGARFIQLSIWGFNELDRFRGFRSHRVQLNYAWNLHCTSAYSLKNPVNDIWPIQSSLISCSHISPQKKKWTYVSELYINPWTSYKYC